MKLRSWQSTLVLCLALLLLAGACAPSAQPAPTPTAQKAAEASKPADAAKPAATDAAPSPQAASKDTSAGMVQELYDAAKKEGEVIWQVGFPDEQVAGLVAAFQKKYPGIKVSTLSVNLPTMPARLVTEASAGRLTVDVAMGSVSNTGPVLERDLPASYDWAKVSDVSASSILLGGKLVVMYDLPTGWVYNTKLVPAADVPKTWEDLLTPKWKGRKLTVTGSRMGFESMSILGKWDKQKYEQFLKDLKSQELVVEPRGSALAERIAQGETLIGAFPISLLPDMLQKGAPIALAPLGPLSTTRTGVYTVRGVPHPNAARLLIAWLGSSEASPEWDKLGRGAATPCNASALARILCDKKVEVTLEDSLEMSEKFAQAEKLGRDLLGIVPQ